MDRCAVFVDAGYLIAEGAKAFVAPTAKRGDVTLDYATVARILAARAVSESGLPLLRTYWYDGAENGVPTNDQLLVGQLPDMKLRLGRLSGGRQKGVDALVYRDLNVLARERAIACAFLVAGDEDLREGVVWAQEAGVHVTLWGIGTRNQSGTLLSEVDRIGQLDELSTHFAIASGSALTTTVTSPPTMSSTALTLGDVGATGRDHAVQWLSLATAEDLADLLAQRPTIPATLDAELLRHARAAHGSNLRDRPDARKALRQGFWAAIDASLPKARQPGGDTCRDSVTLRV